MLLSKNEGRLKALLEVLSVSTKLGLTSFGGPVAHLGYFHNEYIRKRKWLDEKSYADLVALCQFLPGPASSQVGIGIGTIRAGILGGFAAWIGFTLPSIIALILFAYILKGFDIANAGWIHGLKIVAVAIVAQAVWGMGQKLIPDKSRATIAVLACSVTLLWHSAFAQVMIILAAALIGLLLYNKDEPQDAPRLTVRVNRLFSVVCIMLFFGLLLVLPVIDRIFHSRMFSLFDTFYRAGSLVFGGGHVILPLLEREVVPQGWVSETDFLAGYGAAQAVPGPLFTFASYLGTMANGVSGAVIGTAAIFLPAYLLIIGALPFWNTLRNNRKIQGALTGVNASVVGILLAALYNPIWTSAILSPVDFVLALLLYSLLVFWKLPPWIVVLTGAAGGTLASFAV